MSIKFSVEDKKNSSYFSQLLKQIQKDKQEYSRVLSQIQGQDLDKTDMLDILTKAAEKVNEGLSDKDQFMFVLGEVNYRDDANGGEWVKYERNEWLPDRLQAINNLAKLRYHQIKRRHKQEWIDTDDDSGSKENKIPNKKKGKIFEQYEDKLKNKTMTLDDNAYLKQLIWRSKRAYVNREREINPGVNVPAPSNPNGNLISSFKYANTNESLPKCNSIEQFNKEIDERAQYLQNNPNANAGKRTYQQAFEEMPDLYTEKDNYPNLNKFVPNPKQNAKRRRVQDEEDEDEDESMDEEEGDRAQEEEKINISKYFKQSDYRAVTYQPKKDEPTPMWMKKDKKIESPLKEDPNCKVYKHHPYEKLIKGEGYKTLGNRFPQNQQSKGSLPMDGWYQTSPSRYPSKNERKKNGRMSDGDDDYYYNKRSQHDDRNSATGDKYIDDANWGRGFVSAEKQYNFEMKKKHGRDYNQNLRRNSCGRYDDYDSMNQDQDSATSKLYSNTGRQPGLGKRRNFNPPIRGEGGSQGYNPGKSAVSQMNGGGYQTNGDQTVTYLKVDQFGNPHEGYKALDPRMVEIIEREILDSQQAVGWDDIAGLEFAKKTVKELIILPILRPDIFVGIRAPPKGVLLFGPPGTGKTMIGKAIASQSKSTFFNISASALTSKWVGEGEKLVKTLFKLAVIHQPSVIFIDEIDSLLWSRSENENEAGRKIKTEFMVHIGGAGTNDDDKILIIGATNRPFELDEAVRRRLEKRLYIPLPTYEGRHQFVKNLIEKESKTTKMDISEDEIDQLVTLTKGYSGADLKSLCTEAALVSVREHIQSDLADIENITASSIRPVVLSDFIVSLKLVKPSVNHNDLNKYLNWNKDFGSYQLEESDIDT
jgi:fidgetin-like protein 1